MLQNKKLHFLILLILGFAIYAGALGGPFIFDDNLFILNNYSIRSLSNFTDISGTRYIGFLSFALNYAISGYDPLSYKLTNIVIHIINSVLVYQFVSFILKTPAMDRAQDELKYLALIVSLLFLAHPIETQAVNYTVQRFASLATLFYLLSITLYLKARLWGLKDDNKKNSRYALYAFALIAAVLAQKTKEISFTLPIVIVLFDLSFFPLAIGLKERAKRVAPFLITLIIIPASILLPAGGGAGAGASIGGTATVRRIQIQVLTEYSRLEYLITQIKVIPMYFKLLIFPMNQNLLHDVATTKTFFTLETILSFIFLSVIFAIVIYLYIRARKRKEAISLLLSAGILWFFITISVESSIIPLNFKMFEHRVYLPSVGFFIFAATLFLHFAGTVNKKRAEAKKNATGALVIIAIVIVILSVVSFKRSSLWKDKLSIWSDTVAKSPGNAIAQSSLGSTYMEMGMYSEALEHTKEALRINPRLEKALVNFASLLAKSGRYTEAIPIYKEALEIKPDDPYAWYNYAYALSMLGRYNDAEPAYLKAIELNPAETNARNNLANVYMIKGDRGRAETLYGEVIGLDPNHAQALNNLGILLSGKGEFEKSLSYFERALKADPGFDDARFNRDIALGKLD